MFSKEKLELQRKNQGKSEPKPQPLCISHTFAFLSNCSQVEGMPNTSLQTKDQFHFTADNSFRGKKGAAQHNVHVKHFFPKEYFSFLRERPF